MSTALRLRHDRAHDTERGAALARRAADSVAPPASAVRVRSAARSGEFERDETGAPAFHGGLGARRTTPRPPRPTILPPRIDGEAVSRAMHAQTPARPSFAFELAFGLVVFAVVVSALAYALVHTALASAIASIVVAPICGLFAGASATTFTTSAGNGSSPPPARNAAIAHTAAELQRAPDETEATIVFVQMKRRRARGGLSHAP